MGYPDEFKITVSDTQAYRQFGNSVVVPVVERLAQAVRETLARPITQAPELTLTETAAHYADDSQGKKPSRSTPKKRS
jgi:DNA (cytosine-5)-methyltransferase 1